MPRPLAGGAAPGAGSLVDLTEIKVPGEIDLLASHDVARLVGHEGEPCVSLYVPTHRHAPGTDQDQVRFRNLAADARSQLADRGQSSAAADAILAPVEALVADSDFWRYQADGLAVFATSDWSRHFRLPLTFEPQVSVAETFSVRPLLPLLAGDGHFFVLALSRSDVRLFEATRLTIAELAVESLPAGIDDALGPEKPEQQLQLRSGAPAGATGRDAIFHGHRGGEEDTKEALTRYFRVVDRALAPVLEGETAPLVVAGVAYYLPLYRSASRYAHVADGAVEGAVDRLDATELHRQAWEIVAPHFDEERRGAVDAYGAQLGTGRTANNVLEVVPAACQGRVDTLFVTSEARGSGRYEPHTTTVELSDPPAPGDHDLVELAVAETLRAAGLVYAVEPGELPGGATLAALLRY